MIPYVKSLPYVLPSISTNNYGNEEDIATAPYTRKAPYNYGWDWGPRFITEGIWQPVRLETWDALRIENFHIHQQSITTDLANVTAELEIEAATRPPPRCRWRTTNCPDRSLPTATRRCSSTPGSITFPSLSHRFAEALVSGGIWRSESLPLFGRSSIWAVSRQRTCRNQNRTCAQSSSGAQTDQWGKSFEFVVNGISVFAKGADVIPFDSFPNRVTPENHRNILQPLRGRAHEYGSRVGRRILRVR